jgi:hypothetical protein
MPNAYLIIGNVSTRKSATIKALSGMGSRGLFNIVTSSNREEIVYVRVSALQEEYILPDDFCDCVEEEKYENILIPLMIKETKQCPGALRYIQTLQARGWKIRQIVILGQADLPYSLPSDITNINYIPDSTQTPNYRKAAQICKWWDWM